MEKKTAEQILEIIENVMTVEELAFEDYKVPSDFVATEETEKIRKDYNEAYAKVENHPANQKSWDERNADVDYIKTSDEWRALPRPQQLLVDEWLVSLGLGKVIEVEQKGGEGQGDEWYSVKHFVDHDVYIKTEGYYSSYNGTDFYEGYGHEVRPQEITITVYR